MYDGAPETSETAAIADGPVFCVIVPMRNAATTVARALKSLRRQRGAPSWEAIVIDDGSTDASVAAARRTAQDDPRITVLESAATGVDAGVSVARNLGLQRARAEWVIFLDADDALAPGALAAFAASIAAAPHAGVHVGRTRWIDARGRARAYPRSDLSAPFPMLARQSGFALHSATVHRSLATELAGFDPGLRSSEDWDFWMRAARTGAGFATFDTHVADYHATPGSLSRDVATLARNHLTVLARGAAPDPRVTNPAPAFANGAPGDDVVYHQLTFLLWSGARAAVAGLDPVAAFDHVHPAPRWPLEPDPAGALMADAMITYASGDAARLRREWPQIAPRLVALLTRAFPEPEAARALGLAYFAIKQRVFGAAPWGADETVGAVIGGMRAAHDFAPSDFPAECIVAQVLKRGRPAGFAIAPRLPGALKRTFAAWAADAARAAPARVLLDMAPRTLGPRAIATASAALLDVRGYGLRQRRLAPGHVRALAGHRARGALRAAAAAVFTPLQKAAERAVVDARAAATADVLRPKDPRAGAAWDAFFQTADPWDYESAYEVEKYEHALSLLPEGRPARALELACAEGHFTQRLAQRVDALVAVDIASEALKRARARTGADHVQFVRADLFTDALPDGPFDLIVCAEVLYYAQDRATLADVAARIAGALAPGGRVILTHANLVSDDPTTAGFDWGHRIGAATISEVFAQTPGLALAHEIATPLYRVQAFVRDAVAAPIRTRAPMTARLAPRVARDVMWDGAVTPRTHAFATQSACATPILMYHRVTDAPHAGLERYAVTPAVFDAQMRFLRRHGFWTPTLAQWGDAIARCQPLPGRPVIISFDDGYVDFAEHAWPILQHHALGATMFVVTDKVGDVADWDGVATPLMDWDTLARLRDEGLEIGSHSASHIRLSRATIEKAVAEGERARSALRARLGIDTRLFCYPYGGVDTAVGAVIRACGYRLGLSTTPGVSDLSSDPMTLPRIEVEGDMSLETFARRVGIADAAP